MEQDEPQAGDFGGGRIGGGDTSKKIPSEWDFHLEQKLSIHKGVQW